ncbi:MAG: hypothetical protein GXP15_13685 [Gammaproteobacteria bacterium]|nr:hypothetical protein [Gammaproteobacteria bacterium]
MTNKISTAIVLLGLLGAVPVTAHVDDEAIARAVLPLPESMRADAAVFTYDASGVRQMLREGSNAVECRIKDEKEHTWCYPKTTAARRDFSAKLAADGLEGDELRAAEAAAEAAGKIDPVPPGAIVYRLDESDGGIHLLWAVMLPNLTSADLGISSAGRFKSAVAGKGTPWMMREGTPSAHLMIPINGTDLSNQGGADEALDPSQFHPFIRATLALPRDLRREATVISYDKKTGERKTLRKGTNGIVCLPRDEETGFTRCSHEDNLAELDLRNKLAAQGKSREEVTAAVSAATESGEVPMRTFGGLAYRYYEGDDKLKLLWVLRLPGISAAQTGMPVTAERDNLKVGKGTPWLMREGTPSAHLMIPVNGTELSNRY